MKTNTASRPRLLSLLAFTSAFAIAAPGIIRAVESPEGKTAMHGKMMAAMKAADVALASQVSAMNNAPAGQKSELMAAIVTTLVEQRVAMNAKAGQMSEKMMSHMMGHMGAANGSMANCPMMKGSAGMDHSGMKAKSVEMKPDGTR